MKYALITDFPGYNKVEELHIKHFQNFNPLYGCFWSSMSNKTVLYVSINIEDEADLSYLMLTLSAKVWPLVDTSFMNDVIQPIKDFVTYHR